MAAGTACRKPRPRVAEGSPGAVAFCGR